MYSDSNSVYVMIENCTNTATVNGTGSRKTAYTYEGIIEKELNATRTGGIVGYAEKTKINYVTNTGKIECLNTTYPIGGLGGIIGELRNGDITNSYNDGEVKGVSVLGSGGILGAGNYQLNINNCYNKKPITGRENVGGIAGGAVQANISYCYNTQTITTSSKKGGGIVGWQAPFNSADYTDNSMWYCYNIGSVTGDVTGTILGSINYYSLDYTYGLIGTSPNMVGTYQNYKGDGSHYGLLNKQGLISIILSTYGSNFKADTSNINDGYPILSWQ